MGPKYCDLEFQRLIGCMALKYRITGIETLRRIALLQMQEGVEMLPFAEVDESYEERDAYLEGRLTDSPDFSAYDDMLEDDNG